MLFKMLWCLLEDEGSCNDEKVSTIMLMQNALKDDNATQVCCNFFGDGTANNGKLLLGLQSDNQQILQSLVKPSKHYIHCHL